ncbi:MAG: metalloregulator ArsR/SmtB family transcription factor [Halomonas sp.]|nr:metalloregulator ArsR/SmtB family transcription factor [Halomonas sp.]MDN6297820.1 metalloregulator ArsR/SmtB family transcription factor [Halomonas sp.]MDN6315283.1 metalloregulator ArsR/SmtB family transcription factor [Halomonas sp.]MDN6336464.1 metalloregulator ArsR/SmtB family transcription factor [Halomonas sp.]
MPSFHRAAEHLLDNNASSIGASAQLLKAMANAKRLHILCLLAEQELSVTQLNQRLDLSQSALSQHLAILRQQALVTTRRDSQTIYYSLSSQTVKAVIQALAETSE